MKSKYDSSRHVLVEQSEIEEPQRPYEPKYIGAADTLVSDIYHWECNLKIYNEHIASLRTIPCSPSFKGVHDQIYEEGKDYKIEQELILADNSQDVPTHLPVASPVPLAVTGEEDLWKEAFNSVYTNIDIHDSEMTHLLNNYSITRKQECNESVSKFSEDHPILTEPVNYLLSNALKYCTPGQLIQLRDKLIRRTPVECNEAVEFGQWATRNGWYYDRDVNNWFNNDDNELPDTTGEELFQLFKEEQLKTK